VVPRTLRQVTFGSGSSREPAWSPDGQTIAYVSDKSGNADIWIHSLTDSIARRLTFDTAHDSQPSWSPDGRWIAFRSERGAGGVYAVPSSGGAERQIASFGFHPQWSPKGDVVMVSGPTVRTGPRELYLVDASGGTPRRIGSEIIERFIAGTRSMGWLNSVNVNWHPDGTRISVWGQLPNGTWQFVTIPASAGRPVVSAIPARVVDRLAQEGLALGRFSWAPSGQYLYFEGRTDSTRNIWRVSVDPATLAWRDGPDRLTTGTSSEMDIAVSADGTRIAFTARASRTRVWALTFDRETNRLVGDGHPVTGGNLGEVDVDASPDGRKLAYRTRRAGRSEVWEVDTANQTERLLLASMVWRPTTPRWSSDGRRLAYTRPESAGDEPVVALLSTDAGDEQLLRVPGAASLTPTDWSDDGTTIFGSCRLTPTDAMSVCSLAVDSTTGSESVRVLARDPAKNLWVPRLSPDGQWLTFVAVDILGGPTSTVFAAPAAGGEWVPITDDRAFEDKPRWSPDGRTIFFISSRNGALNVWGRRFNRTTGRPDGEMFPVTTFTGHERTLPSNMSRLEFGVSGDRLFVPLTDTMSDVWIMDPVDR
jgi:Tol biopolymer transport system component